MRVLLHSLSPTLQKATTDTRLHWRLLDTSGQVWVSLLWGHCSFLLGPGAQGSVCGLQEPISQFCVSSGSSMVGLMVTSSKRAYAIPKSAAPSHTQVCCTQSPCPRVSPLLTRTSSGDAHSSVSVSVGSLGPGVHKICLSPLSVSGGNGV